jgi:hypothetical protein
MRECPLRNDMPNARSQPYGAHVGVPYFEKGMSTNRNPCAKARGPAQQRDFLFRRTLT